MEREGGSVPHSLGTLTLLIAGCINVIKERVNENFYFETLVADVELA